MIKYLKRLFTKTPEEIIWDEYVDHKATIKTLEQQIRVLIRTRNDQDDAYASLQNKNLALERWILEATKAKDIVYEKAHSQVSPFGRWIYRYTVKVVENEIIEDETIRS